MMSKTLIEAMKHDLFNEEDDDIYLLASLTASRNPTLLFDRKQNTPSAANNYVGLQERIEKTLQKIDNEGNKQIEIADAELFNPWE